MVLAVNTIVGMTLFISCRKIVVPTYRSVGRSWYIKYQLVLTMSRVIDKSLKRVILRVL